MPLGTLLRNNRRWREMNVCHTLWSTELTFWLKTKTTALVDKAEELISGLKGCCWKRPCWNIPLCHQTGCLTRGLCPWLNRNTLLSRPRALQAPNNVHWAAMCRSSRGLLSYYACLTLCTSLGGRSQRQQKHYFKKSFIYLFFSLDFTGVGQEALWRWTGWLTASHPLAFAPQPTTGSSLKPAAETSALWWRCQG